MELMALIIGIDGIDVIDHWINNAMAPAPGLTALNYEL